MFEQAHDRCVLSKLSVCFFTSLRLIAAVQTFRTRTGRPPTSHDRRRNSSKPGDIRRPRYLAAGPSCSLRRTRTSGSPPSDLTVSQTATNRCITRCYVNFPCILSSSLCFLSNNVLRLRLLMAIYCFVRVHLTYFHVLERDNSVNIGHTILQFYLIILYFLNR